MEDKCKGMDELEFIRTGFTPTELFKRGQKLLTDAHKEYLSHLEEGYSEEDALWGAYEYLGSYNMDNILVIWAAGAVQDALECDAVREAIEQAICFG